MVDVTIILSLLASGLLLAGVYMLTSMGMALVFGVMEVVNFAHGGLIMAGGYITYWLFTEVGVDPILSLVVVIPAMFAVGYAAQWVFVEHVVGEEDLYSLLLTFGLLLVLESTFRVVFSTETVTIPYLSQGVDVASIGLSLKEVASGGIGFVVTGVLFAFLSRSSLGQAIRATSQAPDLAEASGINAPRIRAITFGVGSLLAGIGGTAYFISYGISPIGGRHLLLIAFVVIVLGGMGSIKGAGVAAVLIGVFQTFAEYYAGSHRALLVMYLGIAVVLLVRPHGLFGEPEDRLHG
ncbi:branched-chain amino acid ABC transporter permease [Halomarina salina]|uniref:Branched-chain amino acid ABC transporter permease n=1 Tax=Halomarina salina TaxID=1872699 RepID=A0ABD5RTG2_9EURY